MDFLSLFNSRQPSLRNVILLIIIVTPFWFLALELFSKSFIHRYNLYLHIVAAFVITVCWLTGVEVLERLINHIRNHVQQEQEQKEKEQQQKISIVNFSIVMLGGSLLLTYLTEDPDFKGYLTMNFGFLSVFTFMALMIEIVRRLEILVEEIIRAFKPPQSNQ